MPLALVALALLTVACYLPAMLWGGFVWDDNIYLVEAEPVRELGGLWTIWFAPAAHVENHYWPLTYTTFWLEHKLWGFDPTGYHVVNVLLHLANTLLVWHLMRRLAVPGAWLIAAVFAVHPLHVESVAWVIERKDVLSGLFYLAAALMWMRFVDGRFLHKTSSTVGLNCADRELQNDNFRPRWGWYAGSLALYAAALLSKSIVVKLSVALLIWHWWQQGRVTAADLKRLGPFFAVGLAYVVGDLAFSRSVNPVALDNPLSERTLIASRALWFYAGKLVWPSELAVIYPRWDLGVSDRLYLIAAVALVAILWYFRPQLGRGPLAGALFFAVTLSPVLGFVDHGFMIGAWVADRFQYLAGIGIMAVVIGTASHGVGRLADCWQKGAWVVAAVMIVVLGVLTWRQAGIWRDSETLWRHVIEHNPQTRSAHLNLGLELTKQGRDQEAINVFRVAINQDPYHYKAHQAMASALHSLGRDKEVDGYFQHAITLSTQAGKAGAALELPRFGGQVWT